MSPVRGAAVYSIQVTINHDSEGTTERAQGGGGIKRVTMAAEEARVVGSVPPPPAYYKLFAPKGGVEAGETVILRRGAYCIISHILCCVTSTY